MVSHDKFTMLLLFIALTLPSQAKSQTLEELAKAKMEESFAYPPPSGQMGFQISVDFPEHLPTSVEYHWEKIDFATSPVAYMEAVKQHILSDYQLVSKDFAIHDNDRWFHAPWLRREPMHGMTAERGSRAGELWPEQPGNIQNWAVSFYNERGGYTLDQVWKDPLRPDAKAARFPYGTVGFKLLYTAATPEIVPYLQGSKVWKAQLRQGAALTDMRLLQVDIAVRDKRADNLTGWVFGTFMYYDPTHSLDEFSWDNVIPVTLTWGNDPTLLPYDYNRGRRPNESWSNPDIVELFKEIRSKANGFTSSELGLHGRSNGPVDNPGSSCLACHSRAIDFGVSKPGGYWGAVLPFAPSVDDSDFTVQWYFRNLKPDDPFLYDTTSLDYSLQLQVGIRRMRDWLDDFDNKIGSIAERLAQPATTNRAIRLNSFIAERGGSPE